MSRWAKAPSKSWCLDDKQALYNKEADLKKINILWFDIQNG